MDANRRNGPLRQPTSNERAKEVSFLYSNLADTGILVLFLLAAIVGGSLTMLSEAVRGVLLLAIQYYSMWVQFAVHRGRLSRFEFGVGKVEQFVWVVVGLGLIIGGLWVAQRVIGTLFSAGAAASPLGLTLAATVSAVNLVVNYLGWHAMRVAARGDHSGAFGAQLHARFNVLLSNVVLQITLTAAALAKDGALALILDAGGAAFVVVIQLVQGCSMIGRGLPDLLDAPAADNVARTIRRTVATALPEQDILSIRTRRAGRETFVEVTVRSTAVPSVEGLRRQTVTLKEALERHGVPVQLALLVASHQDDQTAGQGIAGDAWLESQS